MSTHRTSERTCILEHSPGGCDRDSNIQYKMGLMVPSVPPTDASASAVCRVKYEILVYPYQQ